MSYAIVGTFERTFGCIGKNEENVASALFVFDLCVIISGIVVGALALYGHIDFTPAASYAALGVGCGFLALDVAFKIGNKVIGPPKVITYVS